MLIKIKAPDQCDQASVGGQLFTVQADGTVEVPDQETADLLIASAGFRSLEPAPAAPEGSAVIFGEPGSSCSFEGVSYALDDSGHATVPAAAVAALLSHGFVAVEADEPPAVKAKVAKAKAKA